jgi:hypothetical protein
MLGLVMAIFGIAMLRSVSSPTMQWLSVLLIPAFGLTVVGWVITYFARHELWPWLRVIGFWSPVIVMLAAILVWFKSQ